MYRKIIVGFDGSERAQDALALGKLLADASEAELVVAGVYGLDPGLIERDTRFREGWAEHTRAIDAAAESVGAEPKAIWSSSVGQGLHALAEEIGAGVVVVGSSHKGRVGQVLAGNIGRTLLQGSPCSVAVAPHGFAAAAPERVEEIILGYDGSDESRLALDDAVDLARTSGALLKLVAAVEPPAATFGRSAAGGWHAVKDEVEEMWRERLQAGVAEVPEGLRVEAELVVGRAPHRARGARHGRGRAARARLARLRPAAPCAPRHRRDRARHERPLSAHSPPPPGAGRRARRGAREGGQRRLRPATAPAIDEPVRLAMR